MDTIISFDAVDAQFIHVRREGEEVVIRIAQLQIDGLPNSALRVLHGMLARVLPATGVGATIEISIVTPAGVDRDAIEHDLRARLEGYHVKVEQVELTETRKRKA